MPEDAGYPGGKSEEEGKEAESAAQERKGEQERYDSGVFSRLLRLGVRTERVGPSIGIEGQSEGGQLHSGR